MQTWHWISSLAAGCRQLLRKNLGAILLQPHLPSLQPMSTEPPNKTAISITGRPTSTLNPPNFQPTVAFKTGRRSDLHQLAEKDTPRLQLGIAPAARASNTAGMNQTSALATYRVFYNPQLVVSRRLLRLVLHYQPAGIRISYTGEPSPKPLPFNHQLFNNYSECAILFYPRFGVNWLFYLWNVHSFHFNGCGCGRRGRNRQMLSSPALSCARNPIPAD